ncbi:GNAT family N-acetyltransferase [Flavivirga abyssicola]|uniref:GNAT family N-acetyltransferase n=1 Tax=Flavivirga abyssicola TaxID=3063533 RepID=UPI0026DFA5C4|nr:GNAT family N-acetyltransferase [Flavivirga sp. MEBiC07777]WVK13845.1 GNAT family N-acetyltransferase [Flavivirga sp. MEBiC07777]
MNNRKLLKSENMEVELKEREGKGFSIAKENSKKVGVMTYSIPDSDFIIIDHTEVEPEFNGKGVGKKMLYKIVEMTREKNLKIIPLCPFANAMFKKLEDIRDVLKQ